jgi:hypothetical protein
MKTKIAAISCLLVLATGLSANADNEEFVDFESIVNGLEGSTRAELETGDPFDNVMIHAGAGVVAEYARVRISDQPLATGLLNGFEGRFGIDLFSPNWQAQGAIRSFSSARISSTAKASLTEFDLSIVHRNFLNRRMSMVFSGGVASRYLRISSLQSTRNYSTPASLIGTGITAHFTDKVGLTVEASWRRAFIDDTADRSGLMASLTLETQL